MLLACLNLKRYPSLFLTKNNLVSLKKRKLLILDTKYRTKKDFQLEHMQRFLSVLLLCVY